MLSKVLDCSLADHYYLAGLLELKGQSASAHAHYIPFHLTNWRQFFIRLPCYWSWISSWLCQSCWSAGYFGNVMTKFIVDNTTDALKTWLTSICFFKITNCRIAGSRSLTRRTNFKFMCLSAYWQKLTNERAWISALIAKKLICI